MRFLPALALFGLVAAALQLWPSVSAEAEALPSPAIPVNSEFALKPKAVKSKDPSSTISPKDLFLMAAHPGSVKGRPKATVASTTKPTVKPKARPQVRPKPKTAKAAKPKSKGVRKSRAHNTTVVTHMEKAVTEAHTEALTTTKAAAVPPHDSPAPLRQDNMDDMEMAADSPVAVTAPVEPVVATTTLPTNDTTQQVLTKADLIALDTVKAANGARNV